MTLTAVHEHTQIIKNPEVGFHKTIPNVYCLLTGTWCTVYKAVTDCLSVWAVLGSNLGMGNFFPPISETSRPDPWPTQRPIQWVPRFLRWRT